MSVISFLSRLQSPLRVALLITFVINVTLLNTANAQKQHKVNNEAQLRQEQRYALPTGISVEEWQEVTQQIRYGQTATASQVTTQRQPLDNNTLNQGVIGIDEVLVQTGYLKAFNAGVGDQAGFSVALSGDTLVIGAPGEDSDGAGVNGSSNNNNLSDSGAVYVFRRIESSWQYDTYIKPPTPDSLDQFGFDVAVSGDTIAVSAPGEDGSNPGINPIHNNTANGSNSGAVYIYTRTNGAWSYQATIKSFNPGQEDLFGQSISLDAETLVVGTSNEDGAGLGIDPVEDDLLDNSGAVYVFVRLGSVWSQQAYIKASNPDANDGFGNDVSISGDTLAVAAQAEDSAALNINGDQTSNTANAAGAVYVFQRTGMDWTQQAYVKAPNTSAADSFGSAVAISGDHLVVGASGEDSNAVGVNGNRSDDSAANAGAAYTFNRANGGTWSFRDYLKAVNTGPSDNFGSTVAISESFIVVGATDESGSSNGINSTSNENNPSAGAAYLYSLGLGANRAQALAYIKASNSETGDRFGLGLALDGSSVAVGAKSEDANPDGPDGGQTNNDIADAGAVYYFAGASSFYSLGGEVSGLTAGNAVQLRTSDDETRLLSTNGSFSFSNRYLQNTDYEVSITGNPTSPPQDCEITNAAGTFAESNVSDISVVCNLRTLSIPGNLTTINQREIEVPIQLSSNGESIGSVAFSLDYDESCLNPDVNNDGELDTVKLNLPADFIASIQFNPADTDGEIDVTIADASPPTSMLLDGYLLSIGFTPDCAPVAGELRIDSEIKFGTDPAPSFGDLLGQDIQGGSSNGIVNIFQGLAGDCNANGSVGASDLISIGIEIFDGDGNFFLDAPNSSFIGSPIGCDANANEIITAADVTCANLLIFNDVCEPLRTTSLTIPEVNVRADVEPDRIWLRVDLDQHNSVVAAVAFSLTLDQSQFDLSQFDLNQDGVPDLINYPQGQPGLAFVNWHANGNIAVVDILLADLASQELPQGLVLEVGIPTTEIPNGGLNYAAQPAPSFSNNTGADINGLVTIGDIVFSDSFERP